MTQDEILVKLEEVGIILKISGEYYLTEKYKSKIPSTADRQQEISKYKKALEVSSTWSRDDYPNTIKFSSGKSLARAFMDACSIPTYSMGRRYRLRSVNAESMKTLTKIIDNPEINGKTLIDAVSHYYASVESPKGFSKFVSEDILDIYDEFMTKENTGVDRSNETWG